MQPLYKPSYQSEPEYDIEPEHDPGQHLESEQSGCLDRERTLAVSLARVVRRSASFTVVDPETNKSYEVSITEKMRDPLELNVMYMKAGPAGESCDCCNGSGVKD